MWHHMVGPIGYADFEGFTHAFLIREPERMIASYLRKREAAAFDNFGMDRQAEFFEREAQRLGHAPPVIDANDVLANPESVLSNLCAALGIPWDRAMLRWPPGRRETDGPWAPHWYGAVEKSTGFGPPESEAIDLPDEAQRIADQCRPYYDRLAAHSRSTSTPCSAHSSRVQHLTGWAMLPVRSTFMQYLVLGVPGGAGVTGGGPRFTIGPESGCAVEAVEIATLTTSATVNALSAMSILLEWQHRILLPLVDPNQTALCNRLLLRGRFHICDAGVRAHVELVRSEREQLEMIMMRTVPLGRAGAAVTGVAEVVDGLRADRLPRRHRARVGGDVIGAPVAERAAGRVRVIDDEREASGALRGFTPAERRRLVRAVAAVLRGDRLAVLKGAAA
jgi:hypothetical protein